MINSLLLLNTKKTSSNYINPTSNVTASTQVINDIITTNITLSKSAKVLVVVSSAFYATSGWWLRGFIKVDNSNSKYIIDTNFQNAREMKTGFCILDLDAGTHEISFGIYNTNGAYEVITIPAFTSCSILAIEL